jgi:hypothetical protein
LPSGEKERVLMVAVAGRRDRSRGFGEVGSVRE